MSEVGRFGWAFSGGWGSGVCAAWLDPGRTQRLTSDPMMTPHPKAFCWDLSGSGALSKNGNMETSLGEKGPFPVPTQRREGERLGLVKCTENPSVGAYPGFRDLLSQASLLGGPGTGLGPLSCYELSGSRAQGGVGRAWGVLFPSLLVIPWDLWRGSFLIHTMREPPLQGCGNLPVVTQLV